MRARPRAAADALSIASARAGGNFDNASVFSAARPFFAQFRPCAAAPQPSGAFFRPYDVAPRRSFITELMIKPEGS